MSESRPKKRKVEFIESYWTGGELGSDYQWNDNHGELIRCKDCKHRSKEMYDYYGNPDDKVYVCQINDVAKKPNWFCADGETDNAD